MTAVILTIHVLIVLALIGVVLLQRSEGGALGMGGGGGGFLTGRGAANALTRTTSILAFLFFATSMTLAFLAKSSEREEDVLRELTGGGAPAETAAPSAAPGTASTDDLLQSLGVEESAPAAGVGSPPEGGTEGRPEPDAAAPAAEEAPAGESTEEAPPPAQEPNN